MVPQKTNILFFGDTCKSGRGFGQRQALTYGHYSVFANRRMLFEYMSAAAWDRPMVWAMFL